MGRYLRGVWTIVRDALFPPRCAGCRRAGALWCAACQARVAWIRPPFCLRCGQPGEQECQRLLLQLDGTRSAAWFKGPLRQAIHAFKYAGQASLAEPLGHVLSRAWFDLALTADVLVPVPLYPSRQRERGYNQAALLARVLALDVRVPVVVDDVRRTRPTATQMTLSAAERHANVAGAFQCAHAQLAGQRVVLVDDVCTTGATLAACAAALWEAGAASVWALTLARAVSM